MTVAQALKHKNRLAQQISRLNEDIKASNSIVVDGVADLKDSVQEALVRRDSMVNELIAVKVAISVATEPVRRRIYELSELKAKIALLRGMSTKAGAVVDRYSRGESVTYMAQLKKFEVDDMVGVLEAEIDAIQEELDKFNHTTDVVGL
jgi:hypothetical protein